MGVKVGGRLTWLRPDRRYIQLEAAQDLVGSEDVATL